MNSNTCKFSFAIILEANKLALSEGIYVSSTFVSKYRAVGVHKANKADRIACARTGWKVRYVTGRVEDKCRRAWRDLLSQSVINISAV
ncbi:hypothetical protein ACTXT7_004710 [Hymenolepis weldensis]